MPRGTKRRAASKKRFKKKMKFQRADTVVAPTRYGSKWNVSQLAVNKLRKGQLGESFKTKLIYAERAIDLNPTVGGAVAEHIFSANGLFDPDITGVGHQCAGFDQIMEFFDHYNVTASKIWVNFSNIDGSNRQYCGIYLGDSTATVSDFRVIVENGLGTYTMTDYSGGGNDVCEISQGVNIAKFLGRKSTLDEEQLRGNASSNPDEQVYFHVWAAPDTGTDSGVVRCSIRIEFVAVFTEPTLIAIS